MFFLILIFVQIILESLPVSSSGHLILAEYFFAAILPGSFTIVSSNKMLSHFLHGPTVVILAAFFYDRWMFLLQYIKICWPYVLKTIGFAFSANVVTFLIYVFFNYMIDVSWFPVGIGFLISSLFLLSLWFCNKEIYHTMTLKKALLIGAIQGVALLPGISRFGTTFVAGCWLGLTPKKSFEFSFIILWPLIFFGFLKSLIAFSKVGFVIQGVYLFDYNLLLSVVISSIISYFVLRFVYWLALSHKLWYFSFFLFFSFILWLVFVLSA